GSRASNWRTASASRWRNWFRMSASTSPGTGSAPESSPATKTGAGSGTASPRWASTRSSRRSNASDDLAMSMLFAYRRVPLTRPAVALGGVRYRPRPIVFVTLMTPSVVAGADALLDTGADDTVFPDFLAARLGLDLSNAPTGDAAGVASTASAIRYAQ